MTEGKSSSNAAQGDGGWKRERTEEQKEADRVLEKYRGRFDNPDPDSPFVGVGAMMREMFKEKMAAENRKKSRLVNSNE